MKVQRENVFTPVTLVLETQKELDYLYGISNSSISNFKDQARQLGLEVEGYNGIASDLYDKINALYNY